MEGSRGAQERKTMLIAEFAALFHQQKQRTQRWHTVAPLLLVLRDGLNPSLQAVGGKECVTYEAPCPKEGWAEGCGKPP